MNAKKYKKKMVQENVSAPRRGRLEAIGLNYGLIYTLRRFAFPSASHRPFSLSLFLFASCFFLRSTSSSRLKSFSYCLSTAHFRFIACLAAPSPRFYWGSCSSFHPLVGYYWFALPFIPNGLIFSFLL